MSNSTDDGCWFTKTGGAWQIWMGKKLLSLTQINGYVGVGLQLNQALHENNDITRMWWGHLFCHFYILKHVCLLFHQNSSVCFKCIYFSMRLRTISAVSNIKKKNKVFFFSISLVSKCVLSKLLLNLVCLNKYNKKEPYNIIMFEMCLKFLSHKKKRAWIFSKQCVCLVCGLIGEAGSYETHCLLDSSTVTVLNYSLLPVHYSPVLNSTLLYITVFTVLYLCTLAFGDDK